jgi:UDP-N-acetylglucosamine--dolichyl-phosphate N-acetylglucosaminephosphotransferase
MDAIYIVSTVLLPFLSFFLVYLLMPPLIKFLKSKGKVGKDIHKQNQPEIADMGGISILITLTIVILMLYFLLHLNYYLVIFISGLITGIIGLLDDLYNLGGKLKPALTLLGGAPILITLSYNPHPALPFLPSTSLIILYPILVPIGIAITSNAVNMLDVINGATPLLTMPIFTSLIIVSLIENKYNAIPILVVILASLLAFYFYNKYPAKTFMGNIGDFFIGGLLGAIAIVFRFETVVLVAMLPYIMHGFYVLSSVGRLFERREIKNKPVILKDGLLYPSDDPKAPITLMRLILSAGPLQEKEVAKVFFFMSCISSILAIITSFLTKI